MKINKFKEYERLYEGSWDTGPLDNDSASDWKWVFGRFIYNEIYSHIEKSISENNDQEIYHGVGMWEYFRDRHIDDTYNMFTEDQISDIDSLTYDASKMLLHKISEMGWKDKKSETEVKGYLEDIISKMHSK